MDPLTQAKTREERFCASSCIPVPPPPALYSPWYGGVCPLQDFPTPFHCPQIIPPSFVLPISKPHVLIYRLLVSLHYPNPQCSSHRHPVTAFHHASPSLTINPTPCPEHSPSLVVEAAGTLISHLVIIMITSMHLLHCTGKQYRSIS